MDYTAILLLSCTLFAVNYAVLDDKIIGDPSDQVWVHSHKVSNSFYKFFEESGSVARGGRNIIYIEQGGVNMTMTETNAMANGYSWATPLATTSTFVSNYNKLMLLYLIRYRVVFSFVNADECTGNSPRGEDCSPRTIRDDGNFLGGYYTLDSYVNRKLCVCNRTTDLETHIIWPSNVAGRDGYKSNLKYTCNTIFPAVCTFYEADHEPRGEKGVHAETLINAILNNRTLEEQIESEKPMPSVATTTTEEPTTTTEMTTTTTTETTTTEEPTTTTQPTTTEEPSTITSGYIGAIPEDYLHHVDSKPNETTVAFILRMLGYVVKPLREN